MRDPPGQLADGLELLRLEQLGREFLPLGLRLLALGDIQHRPRHAHRPSRRIQLDLAAAMNVADRPVGADNAAFHIVGTLGHDRGRGRLQHPVPVAGMQRRRKDLVGRLDRLRRMAENPKILIRPVVRVALQIPVPAPQVGDGLSRRQVAFALPADLLRPVALGQVRVGAGHPDRLAAGIPDDKAPRKHRHIMPRLVPQPVFDFVGVGAVLENRLQYLLRPGRIIGMQEPFPQARLVRELTLQVSHHLPPAG